MRSLFKLDISNTHVYVKYKAFKAFGLQKVYLTVSGCEKHSGLKKEIKRGKKGIYYNTDKDINVQQDDDSYLNRFVDYHHPLLQFLSA